MSKKGAKKTAMVVLSILFCSLLVVGATGLIRSSVSYEKSEQEYTDLQEKMAVKQSASEMNRQIDFEGLMQQNDDFVAWLEVENTNIDYPVVHGDDNAFYLKHTFAKNKSSSGSLFLDSASNGDFSDLNSTIYGHNMKDGSMFSQLERFTEDEFLKQGGTIKLHTQSGVAVYDVVDVTVVDADYSMSYSQDERYITLMTCTDDGKGRIVVLGKLDG